MGFDMNAYNTVVSGASDPRRLKEIHDNEHFGFDLTSIIEPLTELFTQSEVEFDPIIWADLTSSLSRANFDVRSEETVTVIHAALDQIGVLDEELRAKVVDIYATSILGRPIVNPVN